MRRLFVGLLLMPLATLWLGGAGYLLAPTLASHGIAYVLDLDPDFVSVGAMEWTADEIVLQRVLVVDDRDQPLVSVDAFAITPDWGRLLGKQRFFPALRLSGIEARSERWSSARLSLARIDLKEVLIDIGEPSVRIGELALAVGNFALVLDQEGTPSDWNGLVESLPWRDAGPIEPWRWSVVLPRVNLSRLRVQFTDTRPDDPLTVTAMLVEAGLGFSGLLWDAPGVHLETGALSVAPARIEDIVATEGGRSEPLLEIPAIVLNEGSMDWPQGQLVLDDFDLRWVHESLSVPLEIVSGSLAITGLVMAGSGSDGPNAGDFAFSLPVASGGRIDGGGTHDWPKIALDLDVRELALSPLAPWLEQQHAVAFKGATLGLDVAMTLLLDSMLRLELAGDGSIQGLDVRGTEGEPLIAWDRLDARGLAYDSARRSLRVRELALREPAVHVVVNPDRTTNLSRYLPASENSEAAPKIRLDRVRIIGGVIDLTDLGLVLPLTVRIDALAGSLRGIDADPATRATLSVTGEVGAGGLAAIEGQFAALADKRSGDEAQGFSEFELTFRNVDLLPLSPYFATFAGRRVDGGTLDLNLEYRVRQAKLEGTSHAVLQHLQLGERIESPSAFDLPLDLAVALLTDSEGRIDIEIPLTGRVDQPGFRYGGMVRRALGRMLKDTVTAPFRALAKLLGKRFAAAPSIRFSSGSAALLRSERAHVDALAQTLAERPGLALRIRTGVNAKRDALALRRLAVRRAHASRMGVNLEPDEDPGPIAFEDAASQAVLAAMLDSRRGPGSAAAWLESAGTGDGTDVLPAAERYRRLYRLLVDTTTLADAELAALAAARGQAIATELIGRGVPLEQMLIIPSTDLTPAQPSGVQVRLEAAPVKRSR
ncbi:MAG: DUF748 domain-containing protein [Pseudomonadales bacterium]